MTDYAQLARDLREVVRLHRELDEYFVTETFDALTIRVDEIMRVHAPALLELVEAAERGPVGWMRYLNGKPDWAEDCLLSEPSYRDEDAFPDGDGYGWHPLYALTGPKDQT